MPRWTARWRGRGPARHPAATFAPDSAPSVASSSSASSATSQNVSRSWSVSRALVPVEAVQAQPGPFGDGARDLPCRSYQGGPAGRKPRSCSLSVLARLATVAAARRSFSSVKRSLSPRPTSKSRGARPVLSVEQGRLARFAAEISVRHDPGCVFAEVLRALPFIQGYREQFWRESFSCSARSADRDQVRTTLLRKTQDRIDYRGKVETV